MKEMREIKGTDGKYHITKDGEVYSNASRRTLKSFVNGNGVVIQNICVNRKRKAATVARLVAEAYIPNPENKRCVVHINGDKTDNRVENLQGMTSGELQRRLLTTGVKKTKTRYNTPIKVLKDGREVVYKDYFHALSSIKMPGGIFAKILDKDSINKSLHGVQAKYIDDETPGENVGIGFAVLDQKTDKIYPSIKKCMEVTHMSSDYIKNSERFLVLEGKYDKKPQEEVKANEQQKPRQTGSSKASSIKGRLHRGANKRNLGPSRTKGKSI